ncbi:unnamed protein product [Lactuca virosa]|uniref:Uncharacterized protein n=1 Tax=Lactuca virosa TaxID=75947 RepID=A0AAU9NRT9_9ASTR|nr:unnamed protein product [Lactuca virosa]
MDEVHKAVQKPREKVNDVVEEPRDEEFELQVPEDMHCVNEDITTLNGNDDDKEDTPTNMIQRQYKGTWIQDSILWHVLVAKLVPLFQDKC